MSRIPEMRFDGFTEPWEQRKLGEISDLITKGTTPKDKSGAGEVNFIKVENINPDNGEITNTSQISMEEHEGYLKRSQLKENDILFSIAGTLGRVSTVKSSILPANTNQALAIIRLKKGVIEYVTTVLKGKAVEDFIKKNPTVGAQPNLSLEQVNGLEIPFPNKEEQKKIGAYFRNIDHLITLHQRKYDRLKNLKKAYLEKMFPKDGETVPEMRFDGFTEPWEQRKAKDLCSISTGKSNTQDRVDDGIYPFYVRSPIVEHSNRYLFDEEAVLTIGDGVGTGKVFHYVNGKYDLHQRVYRMFDFSEEITAKYFYYYFSNHFYDRVMAMTAKTSVDSVRYEMIADMDIALPKVKEQIAISAYFERLDHLITLHQHKLERLKHLKQAYLQKMFA